MKSEIVFFPEFSISLSEPKCRGGKKNKLSENFLQKNLKFCLKKILELKQ